MRITKKIFVFVWLFGNGLGVFAQNDPRAEEILQTMSQQYKKIKSFQADFAQQILDANDKVLEKTNGSVSVKGNKYRLKTDDQEVFNNGKTIWTYLKSANEVQVSPYKPEKGDLNPAQLYKMYEKDFKYSFVEQIKEGSETFDVIDLTPYDRNKEVFKVRLTIHQKQKVVRSWKIFEKSGRRYLYLLTNFKTDVSLEDANFSFDKTKYPNVEVID